MSGRTILVFGSCSAHDPVYDLHNRGIVDAAWRSISTVQTIYSHTPGEFVQLTRFLRGELDIDRAIRKFIFHDPDYEPSVESKFAIDTADIALVEVCTCEHIMLGGLALHRGAIPLAFLDPLSESDREGETAKAAQAWWSALLAADSGKQRAAAEFLRPRLPRELADDVTLSMLFDAQLVSQSRDELFASLEQFLELLGKPVGFLVHYRRYMPDGRPVSWPPRFRRNLLEFAGNKQIPVFDPQTMMRKHLTSRALDADFIHYRLDFIPTVAEEYSTFIAEIERRYELENVSCLSDIADELNSALVSLHTVRSRELGAEGSGLFQHYTARLDGNNIVSRREAQIVKVVQHCALFRKYHVLRASLGELAFLLAEAGADVIAFEPDGRRLEALMAGLEHLAAMRGWDERRLVARNAKVPGRSEQHGTCCIGIHALLSDVIDDDEVVDRLSGYDAVLFEPRTLFWLREDRSQQEALIERFRAAGFVTVMRFPAAQLVYCAKTPATMRPTSRWSELWRRLSQIKWAGLRQEAVAMPSSPGRDR